MLKTFIIKFRKKRFYKREIWKLQIAIWRYDIREYAVGTIKEGVRVEYEATMDQISGMGGAIEKEKKKIKIDQKLIEKINKEKIILEGDAGKMEDQIKSLDGELRTIDEKKAGAIEYQKVIREAIKRI